ncbi:hypothetical protein GGF32_000345 [Allomyces javanicus]|nr:hypothetical protein GGF32_000345 [Allomyces javanicus]
MFTGGFVVSYVWQDTQQNLPRTDRSEQFPREALEDWTWSGDMVDQLAIELWDKYGREHALVLIKTEPDPADAKKVIYSKDTDIKSGEKLASFITVHNGASWCKFPCDRGVVTLLKGPVLMEKMLHTMVNKDCMVRVMQFGPHVESVKTYKAMLMQLYPPPPTCRGGFMTEATNQSVMVALKRKHGATYGDCEAGYWSWAADLLRATNNHTLTEDMINQALMDGVLRLFQQQSIMAVDHAAQVTCDGMRVTELVIDDLIEDVEGLKMLINRKIDKTLQDLWQQKRIATARVTGQGAGR